MGFRCEPHSLMVPLERRCNIKEKAFRRNPGNVIIHSHVRKIKEKALRRNPGNVIIHSHVRKIRICLICPRGRKKNQTLVTCDTPRGSRPNRDHGDRTNDMYRPPWRFGQKCAHEEVCAKTKANSQLYVYTRFPSGTCLGEWRKNELKTYSMLFVSYAYYDIISRYEILYLCWSTCGSMHACITQQQTRRPTDRRV